jgi:hypothetical protein
MEKITTAKNFLKTNKFSKALEELNCILNSSAADKSELVQAYELTNHIYKITNLRSSEIISSLNYFNYLFKSKLKESYLPLYLRIKILLSGNFLQISHDDLSRIGKAVFEIGEVKEALELFRVYLNRLVDEKRSDEGLEYISYLETERINISELSSYKLYFWIIQGNESAIKLIGDIDLGDKSIILMKIFISINQKRDYWLSHPEMFKFSINYQLKLLEKNKNILAVEELQKYQKNILNRCCEYLVTTGDVEFILEVIGVYCGQLDGSEAMAARVNEIRRSSDITVSSEAVTSLIDSKTIFSDFSRTDYFEKFDMADDLFSENKNSQGEDVRLENEIMLLLRMKRFGKAREKLSKLKVIDPSNTLVLDLEDLRPSEKKMEKIDSPEEIVENLKRELKEYLGPNSFEVEDPINEECLVKYFSLSDEDDLKETIVDLIISFLSMRLYVVTEYLVNKAKKLEVLDELSFSYYAYELNFKQERYFECLIILNDILNTPLSKEDRVCFVYLRAEAYYLKGDLEKAKQDYRWVKRNQRYYRLSNQRLIKLA